MISYYDNLVPYKYHVTYNTYIHIYSVIMTTVTNCYNNSVCKSNAKCKEYACCILVCTVPLYI